MPVCLWKRGWVYIYIEREREKERRGIEREGGGEREGGREREREGERERGREREREKERALTSKLGPDGVVKLSTCWVCRWRRGLIIFTGDELHTSQQVR